MIVMDFDGVLFNTVKEAYVISMLATDRKLDIEEITFDNNHYKSFEKLRYSVGPASDYLKVLQYLNDLPINGKFDINSISIGEKELLDFSNKFYEVRNLIIDNQFNYWIKLNSPYEFFNMINRLKNLKTIILTNKDEKSVLKILTHHKTKFEYLIIDNNFLHKFNNKIEVLDFLSKDEKLIYIDDNQGYVDASKGLVNVDGHVAGWGYTGKRSAGQTTQKNIYKIVKDIVGS